MKEKLQKILARSGVCSRREAERWIEAGRVSVNGSKATLGDRVSLDDRIKVDGKPVSARKSAAQLARVILYNKPVGEISTRSDPEGRPTVFDKLPAIENGRWIAIGRLDINTSGLLLFTNNGELANRMMHPSGEMDREYAVRLLGKVDEETLRRLKEGVMLEDGMAAFSDIQPGRNREDAANQWYYCVIREGRNREVRRLWESQGIKVSRLKRVRYGSVFIPPRVREGAWAEMSTEDVKGLYKRLGMRFEDLQALDPEAEVKRERAYRKQRSVRGGRHKGTSRRR